MDQNKKMYTFLRLIPLEIGIIVSLLVWIFIKMPTKAQIFCLIIPILRASLKVRKKDFLFRYLLKYTRKKKLQILIWGKSLIGWCLLIIT